MYRGSQLRTRQGLAGVLLGFVVTLSAVAAFALQPTSGAADTGAPANTSLPTISGTAKSGQTLSASSGTWVGTAPITYTYEWQRCATAGSSCAQISGATGQTYALSSADVGSTIRVIVTATNSAGQGSAASSPTASVTATQAPTVTSPPSISGISAIDQTLTANPGEWSGPGPIAFTYLWLRCDASGANCASVKGATSAKYTTTPPDGGDTFRLVVTAKNGDGSTTATTGHTAVIATTSNGCPIGANGTIAVASIATPARLSVDAFQFAPQLLNRATTQVTARIHVSGCGRPVQGALVYLSAVPYNQFTVPPEAATDGSGWASVTLGVLSGYPADRRQQLLAVFVRARKPGGSLLGGISTRRLISTRVDLRG